MVRHVNAVFSQGAFRPLEPLALPEGTRVHLSVEEDDTTRSASSTPSPAPAPSKIHTPKLANPKDAADFIMNVRETGHASL